MFKIIKENKFGDLIREANGDLYYKGSLRGHAFEDGSWFTIADFSFSNNDVLGTFKVYIYNQKNELIGKFELDCENISEAEGWIESVMDLGYNSAIKIYDEFGDEDNLI